MQLKIKTISNARELELDVDSENVIWRRIGTTEWNNLISLDDLTNRMIASIGIENLKGEKGDQGIQGERGLQGFEGPQGEQGPAGPVGGIGPIISQFVIENDHFVLIMSDGSKVIGPEVITPEIPDTTMSKLSGTTWPTNPQSYPANLIPQSASDFDSASDWNSFAGLTIEDGKAKWDGTSVGTSLMLIPLISPAVSGNQFGMLISHTARTSGASFPGLQHAGNADVANGSGAGPVGYYSRQLQGDGAYTHARLAVSEGSLLDIDYYKIHDLTEMQKKKQRIVFNYCQSNGVGPGDAPDADKMLYDTPEPRAIAIPSSENGVRGSSLDAEGNGVPMLMSDPIQHLSGNVGGGPAGAFARTFCDGLRDDEVLVYVATGYSGGGRTQPGDVWYRDPDGLANGIAWDNMLKQVDAVLARAPEGSTVAGMIFCQGEADLADTTGDQHAQIIRQDFELLRERYGDFPIVMNEIGWADTERADVANMIASHAKLDSNSGDALSLPLCRYVPRPVGSTFLDDTLHYDQPTQRIRGQLTATAMLELNYGSVQA